MEYVILGIIILIIILAVISTVSFNKKPPMTREEFEKYEKEKRDD